MAITKEKMLDVYRLVLLSRKLDDKLHETGVGGGGTGLHLGAGQEAMPVAAGCILRRDDYLKPSHRVIGGALAKGVPLKSLIAGMMGKVDETGKILSFAFAPEYGIMGISGTLGEEVPIYVGMALSSTIQEDDRVTVIFFGDGTSNRGPVHEAMNLAGVWKLPVVFICENNQYGISLHVSKSVAADDIADRAAGYGMPGVVVDGNDVLACYEVAENAIRIARRGGGPSFIEAKTYRLRGHFEGDSQSYRTPEEVEIASKREPVGRFTKALLKAKVLSAQDVEKYDAETTQELEAAFKYAEDLPTLPIEAMMETLQG